MTPEIGHGGWREDILDRSAIAVVSYPLRAKQRDRLHSHAYHQIAYGEQPGAALALGQRMVDMPRTGGLLVPRGTLHALTSDTRCVIRCVYFKAALPNPMVRTVFLSRLTKELISEISYPPVSERSRQLMASCLYDQIGQLLWLRGTECQPVSPALRVVCERLIDAPETDASIAELASDAGIGERTLRRLAREQLGCTIVEFRTKCRVFEATRQLQAGLPVKTVAPGVGFQSDSAFFAAFRGVVGMSPAQFQTSVSVPR